MYDRSRSDSYSFLTVVVHPGCRHLNKGEWIQEWKDNGSPFSAHAFGLSSAADGLISFQGGELDKKSRAAWARFMFLPFALSSRGTCHLYSCQRATRIIEAALEAGASLDSIIVCPDCDRRAGSCEHAIFDEATILHEGAAEYHETDGPWTLLGGESALRPDHMVSSVVNHTLYRLEGGVTSGIRGSAYDAGNNSAGCSVVMPVDSLGPYVAVRTYGLSGKAAALHTGWIELKNTRDRFVYFIDAEPRPEAVSNQLYALAIGALRTGQDAVFYTAYGRRSASDQNRAIASMFGQIEDDVPAPGAEPALIWRTQG